MIWRCILYPISIVVFSAVLYGCFQSDYTKLVKSELAKGIRQDSLLFGIRFGDTRNDFYGKCFDLNKQKIVAQGPGNSSVQYLFKDSSIHNKPTQIRLLFYPSFDKNDVIAQMNFEFSYPGWAPWNKEFQADSLKVKAMELLMLWYKGNEFVTADVNNTKMPVKLDGNRRLLVYIKDAQSVVVKAQDILHPNFKHSTK
ncbi:MAG: hypothetical protein ABIP52_17545 [Cyclobacteriaceae bacterium]